MTHYLVYDVFTDKAFGGNQLAVFPDASDIPEDLLPKITAEFNFSEVVFVYPPIDPKNTARVRIFTPTSEVDFAGHPTIGTLIALFDLGHTSPMILELGIGPLQCTVSADGASFTTSQPLQKLANPSVDLVARALGVTESAIVTKTHPPLQASLGLAFVLVELDQLATLAACRPNVQAIGKGAEIHPAGSDFAIFTYVRDGGNITSRMFAPLDNIPEDPATGSASATLAAVLTEVLDEPQSLIFSQGQYIGRPSKILASTTQNPTSVTITGQAVKTMAGTFILKA
jgi:trans-2,3-dihydro-3-hydroxyanthranilate isomerase